MRQEKASFGLNYMFVKEMEYSRLKPKELKAKYKEAFGEEKSGVNAIKALVILDLCLKIDELTMRIKEAR